MPIGLLAIPAALCLLAESSGAKAAFDRLGAALATAAGLALIWGLVQANGIGWSSPEVVASLAGGGVLAASFVGWERRAAHPVLPVGLFRARAFAAGNGAGFFRLFGSTFGVAILAAAFAGAGSYASPRAISNGFAAAAAAAGLSLLAAAAGLASPRRRPHEAATAPGTPAPQLASQTSARSWRQLDRSC